LAAFALHRPAADCIASLTRSGIMRYESKCPKDRQRTPKLLPDERRSEKSISLQT
jgi:hypothetical protein